MQISNIFASVLGESKRNTQFRVVLAGQGANSFIVDQGLTLVNLFFGPPSKYFYAISSAPYFSIPNKNETLTVDSAFEYLRSNSANSPKAYQYMTYVCLSKYYGLKHMAYEGGPDTFGPYNVAIVSFLHQQHLISNRKKQLLSMQDKSN